MFQYIAPAYLGWSVGANDASNIFGTAVATKMIRFSTAAGLGALFVLVGALAEGRAGMDTISKLTSFDLEAAVLSSLAAALTVTVLTVLKIPVSSSQAVLGAILGVGLFTGGVSGAGLSKVLLCWVGTPVGGLLFAMVLYLLLGPIFNLLSHQLVAYDIVLRAALVVVGCYGAYALGANNVANVTGVFVGADLLSPWAASLLGGLSIGVGIMTYSRRVMMTVGTSILRLNAYSAFIVVLSQAITVHLYAKVGVPVSSSQAVIGAVLGVGILKSVATVRYRALLHILIGWVATPLIAALFSVVLYFISHLRYVPN